MSRARDRIKRRFEALAENGHDGPGWFASRSGIDRFKFDAQAPLVAHE